MLKLNFIFRSGSVGILTIVVMTLLSQDLGWAASISCDTTAMCNGTNGDDVMRSGDNDQKINGRLGDDIINSRGGDDDACGAGGNDKIHLGNGDDRAWGDGNLCGGPGHPFGADSINGGPGNDFITHGEDWTIDSDGFKDFLDCGPGDDIVQLNITIDHDEASNCEHINPFPEG